MNLVGEQGLAAKALEEQTQRALEAAKDAAEAAEAAEAARKQGGAQ